MPRVAFYTLGCKLNYSETSTIGSQFAERGYSIVDFSDEADVYVVNTCTVTENAEKDCRKIIRRALRKNPEAYVAVTGCYAQLRAEEIAKIDGVDAVLGSNEKFKIHDLIPSFEKQGLSCVYVSPTEELDDFSTAASSEDDARTRAFFKIQDGCDYSCTFCTIPLARGGSRSKEIQATKAEFEKLLESGYKEIILTGVNVGDYGNKSDGDFFDLLTELLKSEGEYRIRISSIEPNLLSDRILELAASDEKLCSHFHIPLQSGSDKILRLMKRRYNTSFYRDLISRVSERVENVGIGVDVISGFPSESEEDFLETYNFLKDLPISYLHVFTYSERPNTPALEINPKVDPAEKKRRTNMLRILSDKKRSEFHRRMEGKQLDVLFEHENKGGKILGFAGNYVRVALNYDQKFENNFTKIRVKEAKGNICTAEFIGTNLSTKLAV